jgi:hypothetical protein
MSRLVTLAIRQGMVSLRGCSVPEAVSSLVREIASFVKALTRNDIRYMIYRRLNSSKCILSAGMPCVSNARRKASIMPTGPHM